ncbi:AI-2 transport protein TqsA [Paraliobacillus sp. PM-2]|uniref:AI-2E family transporter n=1 Tax=Paraliobacillus sp. PM-2 TaxID=1462524 RepID=UPI00061C250C|nr:AI-2E family transporter [Paraliobacillus sp. PM-2]CQR46931.1 AI-2 transport protein TqsA [Paraliobacillus sp. PM-2]
MLSKRMIRKWLSIFIVGIVILLFIYLLHLLFPFYRQLLTVMIKILTPFLIAAFIAYLLHPLIEKIHQYHVPRSIVIIGIYILFFGGIIVACYHAFPALVKQMKDLQQSLPNFFDTYRSTIYQLYEKTAFLPESFHDQMDMFFNHLETSIENWVANILKQVTRIMDIFMVIAVIPVLVFYMLKDFHLIKSSLIKLFPRKYQPKVKQLWPAVDQGLGSYIRGQLIVCFFVGLTSYLILLLIKMKYPLVLAIIMAVTNIIPYFGPIIGALPAIIIAFTISTKQVIYVALGVVFIQIIEGNLLSPYIVGKSVHLHPILIILILLVGGEIAGIIGMIVAIPLATVVKVVIYQSKDNNLHS